MSMVISKSSHYAIYALVYLGLNRNRGPVLSQELASRLNISRQQVANILNLCRKNGFVTSKRGLRGGYSLNQKLQDINLMQILLITEGSSFKADTMGYEDIPDMHGR